MALPVSPASRCIRSVKSEPKSVLEELMQETENYRNPRIKASGGEFYVKGKKYSVIGQLGKSSSIAYLVKDETGTKYVLKELIGNEIEPNWAFSANYETIATQFYSEMGFILPKVVAVQYSKKIGQHTVGIIIKEYRPGITATELELLQYSSNNFWVKMGQRKLKELPNELNKLRKTHELFLNWLNKNNIDLFDKNFLQLKEFIMNGDIFPENMLLDAQTGQWILFDP